MDLPKCRTCGERHRLGSCLDAIGGRADAAPPAKSSPTKPPRPSRSQPMPLPLAPTSVDPTADILRVQLAKAEAKVSALAADVMRLTRDNEAWQTRCFAAETLLTAMKAGAVTVAEDRAADTTRPKRQTAASPERKAYKAAKEKERRERLAAKLAKAGTA